MIKAEIASEITRSRTQAESTGSPRGRSGPGPAGPKSAVADALCRFWDSAGMNKFLFYYGSPAEMARLLFRFGSNGVCTKVCFPQLKNTVECAS